MKNKQYSWDQINSMTMLLVERIRPVKHLFSSIYGIPRGGLILAVILSHHLGIPLITKQQSIGRRTLIVDELVQTGKQIEKLLRAVKRKRSEVQIATLFVSTNSKIVPNYYISKYDDKKSWLVMPWEPKAKK